MMLFPNLSSWMEFGWVGYNLVGIPLLIAREGLEIWPMKRGVAGHDIQGFSIPSKVGWGIAYVLNLSVFGVTLGSLGCSSSPAAVAVGVAFAAHFFKRLCEVLFVHNYTSRVDADFVANICMYTAGVGWFAAHTMSQHGSNLDNSQVAMGFGICMVGELVNGYHHLLLSRNRRDTKTKYFAPQGGLFQYVLFPHYLGELTCFLGFAVMLNHLSAWLLLASTTAHLTAVSYARRKWYIKKVDKSLAKKAAIFPLVF